VKFTSEILQVGREAIMSKIIKFWLIFGIGLVPMAVQAQNLNDIIPVEPSQPSLWWQSDRLGQGLIESWAVDQDAKLITLKINAQVWLASDFIKRYTIVQKLSNIARQDGYDLRLENNRQIKLAEYKNVDGIWKISPRQLGATPFSGINGNIFGVQN
jgi:hypothetical protein